MCKRYSIDGEEFSTNFGETFDSIVANGDLYVGFVYQEADAVFISAREVVNNQLPYILEGIDQYLCDNWLIESLDNEFSGVSRDAKNELKDFMIVWAQKHTKLETYFEVKNVVEKKITQEDVDEYNRP